MALKSHLLSFLAQDIVYFNLNVKVIPHLRIIKKLYEQFILEISIFKFQTCVYV